jgi:hypothetical protein
MQVAADMAGVNSALTQSVAAFNAGGGGGAAGSLTGGDPMITSPLAPSASAVVPEPTSLILAALGAAGLAMLAARTRRAV